MNTVNYDDEAFRETSLYSNFQKENPASANLNIRASSANLSVPISGVKIIVSKNIGDYKVIFFDGITDMSGMINNIKLPTPSLITNDLDVPNGIIYDVEAIYDLDNIDRIYKVLMYPGICVVQNINLIPSLKVSGEGEFESGS